MRAIEKLEMILLALEKVERLQGNTFMQVMENRETLLLALRSQAKELILEHKLETGEKYNA